MGQTEIMKYSDKGNSNNKQIEGGHHNPVPGGGGERVWREQPKQGWTKWKSCDNKTGKLKVDIAIPALGGGETVKEYDEFISKQHKHKQNWIWTSRSQPWVGRTRGKKADGVRKQD